MTQFLAMTGVGSDTQVADTPLNVVEMGGTGQPIILMHGWGQNLDAMRLLGDLLSKHYHVYLIDLPGFGKSPKPPSDWDTAQYAGRIDSFLHQIGIAPCHVLGHSFGGRVAIRLASRYPSDIQSVCLINSGGLRRTLTGKRRLKATYLRSLSKALKAADRIIGSKFYEQWFVPKYASQDYKNAGALKNILVKAVNEDVSEDASKIKAQTLLLWGELDDETPYEIGMRLNRLISGSKLVVMPGKDHFPFMDEGAHLCASYILRFLAVSANKNGNGNKESRV